MMNNSSNKIWRNDITGLRALAVIPVLIYHAFPELMPGGFFGVDIFFVISGYLISGIIFRGVIHGNFSFLTFYEKRIRRILPNLILCLIFCLVFGWFYLTANEYENLAKHVIAGSFFVQNFNLFSEIGYFTEDAVRKPLLHLWSLSIEEQFYMLFPICCLAIWKFSKSSRQIGYFVLGIFIFSFVLCELSTDVNFRFYFPLTRFWEIGGGILIAYAETFGLVNLRTIPKGLRHSLSIIGLVLVISSMFLPKTISSGHPGIITLIPVLGASLFILAMPDAVINKYLLCQKPMTFTGLISYSLYLWHWPLLSFLFITVPEPSFALKLTTLVFSFVLSSVLYITYEQPIRRSQFCFAKLGVCSLTCFSICFVCLLSGAMFACKGLPQRAFNQEFTSLYGSIRRDTADHKWKNFHTEPGYSKNLKIHGKEFPSILFVGDSHMYAYQHKILDLSKKTNISVGFLTYPGCNVLSGYKVGGNKKEKHQCTVIKNEFYSLIKENKVKTIVIAQMWGSYYSTKKSDLNSGIDQFNNLINQVDRTYVILDAPWGDGRFYDPLSKINRFDLRSSDFTIQYSTNARWYKGNSFAKENFSSKVKFIYPGDYVCKGLVCDSLAYRDTHHLRNSFLLKNATWIDPIFEIERIN